MQDGRKAFWRIPCVSVAFFPSLKQNFIAYRSSKVSSRADCIFGIHQLWQSGFSRVYSNCCCSCSFEAEIIKISPSSHKMYSNNVVNFQEYTTILNACTKKSGNLLNTPRNVINRIWHWITIKVWYAFKPNNLTIFRSWCDQLEWKNSFFTSIYVIFLRENISGLLPDLISSGNLGYLLTNLHLNNNSLFRSRFVKIYLQSNMSEKTNRKK